MSSIQTSENDGMDRIVTFIRTHLLGGSLPNYACVNIKPEGVVRRIEKGKIEYYADARLSDYFKWIYNCRLELINCSIVDFKWKGDRYEVIFLPCSKDRQGRMVACFEHKGTWYHILYKENPQEFLVYCNFVMAWDKKNTLENLNVLSISKPTIL